MARPDKGRRRRWRFRLNEDTILEVSAPEGPTEKQVRRRGRVSLVLGTLLLTVALATVAYADNVVNDVTVGVNDTIPAGGSLDVDYWIVATGGTCDAADGSAATVTINVPANVTVDTNPSLSGNQNSVTFTSCGTGSAKTGTFTSAVAANYNITCSVSDSSGSYNLNPCAFTLKVLSAGDTTDPDGASVVIDDGAAWTNDSGGSVSVDISAHDAVGIDRYRLATTQAGLDSASDVGVSPAEVSFSRNDLAFTLSAGDGTAKAVWARFCDAADNCTEASDTIGLDTVKPVISGSTGAYVPGTWANQDVTVSFTCADDAGTANSGIATDTVAGATLSTSGADQSVTNTGDCIDNAGNEADAVTVGNIDIDKIAPSVSCNAATFILNQPAAVVSATVTDQAGLSGPLNATESAAADTASIGSKSVSVTGYDNAGNSTTVSCSYTVGYAFDGLFAPIDKPNAINVSKAGQAIPLKWRLTDYFGNGVTDLTSVIVTVSSVSCAPGTTSDAIEEYAAGSSGLQNLGDGYYQFNWKTPTSYAGSCKSLSLNLGEGVVRSGLALISFKK